MIFLDIECRELTRFACVLFVLNTILRCVALLGYTSTIQNVLNKYCILYFVFCILYFVFCIFLETTLTVPVLLAFIHLFSSYIFSLLFFLILKIIF